MLTCFIGHTFQLHSNNTMMSILHVNMFRVNWQDKQVPEK